jgi:hypothetical protein
VRLSLAREIAGDRVRLLLARGVRACSIHNPSVAKPKATPVATPEATLEATPVATSRASG